MTAGRRDQLVTLERATTTQDGYGGQTNTWGSIGQEWAAVYYGAGSERRTAAAERGSQAATFQFHSNSLTSSLTISDRIQFGGTWDIESISPDAPRRGYIEATAVRST